MCPMGVPSRADSSGEVLGNLPGHLFNPSFQCVTTASTLISPSAKKGKETYVLVLHTGYRKETEKYTKERILQREEYVVT